jgi:deaminated glutathione amidase
MKIAVLQMTSGIDPARNADIMVAAVAEVSKAGAMKLFTPEMAGLLDRNRERAQISIRAERDDLVLHRLCVAAKEHKIWLLIGSLAVEGFSGKLANRSFILDADGNVRARYDKMHLFDVDLPTGERWRESAAYAPGESAVICDTPLGPMGMTICYDMRFPALYAALSGAGAQIFTVPSAFTVPTGKAHWHSLLRARAIENAAFVIAPAQTGIHQDGRETYGHSLVIDPWGEVLLDMGDGPGLGFADLDLDQIAGVRARIPVLEHRREIPQVEMR